MMDRGPEIAPETVKLEETDNSGGNLPSLPEEMHGSGKRTRVVNGRSLSAAQTDIIIKLCAIKAYDGARRILSASGDPVLGSDIILLLDEALSPRRALVGMKEFVDALARARVEPNSILNDNVRLALEKKISARRARQVHGNTAGGEISDNADKRPTTKRTSERPRNQLPRAVVRLEKLDLDKYKHMFTNKPKR